MTTKRCIWTAVAASLVVLSLPAAGADTASVPGTDEAKQPVFGSQLMTRQERIEYRNKMRSLSTPEAREAFRLQHHKLMQQRAKERGLTLPNEPPAGGARMGPGRGTGQGTGPGMGPGMGPGGRMRQGGSTAGAGAQGSDSGLPPDGQAK